MGTYTVWVATAETDRKAAYRTALELIQPYDETDNDIPGGWPGMSFDCCEPLALIPLPHHKADLRKEALPDTLITEDGQIRMNQPDPGGDAVEYRPVTYGDETTVDALLEGPPQNIAIMRWHC